MKKSTIGAMVLALLLGSFALAYGVGEASAQFSSREPGAVLVHEDPTPSPTPTTSSERIPAVKPSPRATPRPKPKPRPKPALHAGPTLIGPQTSGDRVRDLQARLKQIAWYFAEETATNGPVTTGAVKGYQANRQITYTGLGAQRTLDRLNPKTRTPTDD